MSGEPETWIRFEGLRELDAAFAEILAASLVEVRSAVSEAALLVQAAAQRHASGRPGPNVITGTLRRSIRIQWSWRGEGGQFVDRTAQAFVGPTTVYGRIQELGGDAGRNHAAHIPPRPYLGPAVVESRDDVRAIFRRHMTTALTRGHG